MNKTEDGVFTLPCHECGKETEVSSESAIRITCAVCVEKRYAQKLLCSCGQNDCEPGYLLCPECIARDD